MADGVLSVVVTFVLAVLFALAAVGWYRYMPSYQQFVARKLNLQTMLTKPLAAGGMTWSRISGVLFLTGCSLFCFALFVRAVIWTLGNT